MHHLTLTIHGKVQGVWFRAQTKKKADALRLVGYAKNNPDGSVTVVAEGDKDALLHLLAFCHIGSPAAHVESIEEHWEKIKERQYKDFEIK
ncbi:MAG: hypothetical protein A3J66_03450 [Candidatus Magasanikbacteria bacterium RIFCSPHIGHO2_02_FULL_47_14]|uniref:Acylphosphatase n=1 Tax=Candidatus Magasanikbacteria bacterium RIFCSPHIGHO2_02_FULL_47_14 TaxID=1798680 RepID=A0A1F6MAW1_9BACT|nr:MAG: hypothetical protein A3J66_03450 [Candidatus Magasanikbacteria bacterium RIFCSPHIGHO2_02_FULL_47_14]